MLADARRPYEEGLGRDRGVDSEAEEGFSPAGQAQYTLLPYGQLWVQRFSQCALSRPALALCNTNGPLACLAVSPW